MNRRPILSTFHTAVDFLIVPYKACMDRGGGGREYIQLLYILATTGGGGWESKYVKLLYVLDPPLTHPYS
jgi:hypothetical protein